MNKNIVINSAKDICLNRHGVIEAHAGTGKTYTIVNLVLEMLKQPCDPRGGFDNFVHLRDILLVTFTEKAAGELKTRIQDGIISRIKETDDVFLAAHLENCLNNMHEAFIGTIHSVCLRLLQTWPFESGVYFDSRLTDDGEEIQFALRESMRTDWQDETTQIPAALAKIGELGITLKEKHFALIKKSARILLNDDAEIDETLERLPLYNMIHLAARALAKRYARRKLERGLISYDDMLRLTHGALTVNNSAMKSVLKRRLRYGIIDEFQDTSPIQWKIFKSIFLDDDDTSHLQTAPKMYIVGDPKQSIYSVQNADIQSYLDAKNTIADLGGNIYSLVHNYRSLPEMISGYNAILRRKNCDGHSDWFCFDNGGGISYPPEQNARPPERAVPQYPLRYKAVQSVPINKDEEQTMAKAASGVIKKMRGAVLSIPKGLNFEEITLDYKDFAVIVETNSMADQFIEEFTANGIPCMKYKLHGIFTSAIARDMIAVLAAIIKKRYRPAALLTHFFCGENQCADHLFDKLKTLADKKLWAQLFENILKQTTIQTRLIRLFDGERKLADLRQVTDYCMEYLYTQNSSLEHLTDHLKRLNSGEEQAERDKNIYALSTEKSCVTILTMHASKGLEFPVVFMMTRGGVRVPNGPNTLSWTSGENNRRFTPYLTIAQKTEERASLAKQIESYLLMQKRERRRLLYVAMTRPQAMLFAPHNDKEQDLTPHLAELLNSGDDSIEIFDVNKFDGMSRMTIKSNGDDDNDIKHSAQLIDIPALSLQKFIAGETSYTKLSSILKERDNSFDNSDDSHDDNRGDALPINEIHASDVDDISAGNNNILPGGRLTGIALHEIIEKIFDADNAFAVVNDDNALNKITADSLRKNGIFDHPLAEDHARVTTFACALVKRALTNKYADVVVSQLQKTDRVCEAQFLFTAAPHRVNGSMDLLFRVPNDAHAAHPYRYHFIDWKSDTLQSYDDAAVRRHCADKNYNLQSQIYAVALDKYLRGILGKRYSRNENLGVSIYVFLRGGGVCVTDDLCNFVVNGDDNLNDLLRSIYQ